MRIPKPKKSACYVCGAALRVGKGRGRPPTTCEAHKGARGDLNFGKPRLSTCDVCGKGFSPRNPKGPIPKTCYRKACRI